MRPVVEYGLKTIHTLVIAWLVVEGISEIEREVSEDVVLLTLGVVTVGTIIRLIYNEERAGDRLSNARVESYREGQRDRA